MCTTEVSVFQSRGLAAASKCKWYVSWLFSPFLCRVCGNLTVLCYPSSSSFFPGPPLSCMLLSIGSSAELLASHRGTISQSRQPLPYCPNPPHPHGAQQGSACRQTMTGALCDQGKQSELSLIPQNSRNSLCRHKHIGFAPKIPLVSITIPEGGRPQN